MNLTARIWRNTIYLRYLTVPFSLFSTNYITNGEFEAAYLVACVFGFRVFMRRIR